MRRREFMASIGAGAGLVLSSFKLGAQAPGRVKRNGRLKQGVTNGVFARATSNLTMEDCCREASRLGVTGFDFADDMAEWPILKKYGMVVSMYRLDYPRWKDGAMGRGAMPPPNPNRGGAAGPGADAGRGGRGAGAPNPNPNPPGWGAISHKEAQGEHLKAMHAAIDIAAANSIPNIILLAGGRIEGKTEPEGADNAVAFCNQVKAHAEDKGVTLAMELISSNRGPTAYIFDHFDWGLGVVKAVNSPRVKILYDIYHAQRMDGNIVQTLRDNIQWISHIHTGGVPGRHELDDTQELNWRYIAQALVDLKFTGFVTHEWSPAPGNDPIASLDKVVGIMDV